MTSAALEKVLNSLPSQGLDFEYCSIQQLETKRFTISNPTSNTVRFDIATGEADYEFDQPFELEPKQGALQPGGKQEISVRFRPAEAKVVISTVVVNLAAGDATAQRVLKMSGIGKFPFVSITAEKADFESLTVGKEAFKTVELRNYSLVKAEYTIVAVGDDGKDDSIALTATSGVIAAGDSERIGVTFSPKIVGQFTCRQYAVNVVGGNSLKLTCTGQANGIDCALSTKSIHFGEVQLTTSTNRLLNIINDSDQATSFQFYNDRTNVFSFSQVEGVIQPHSQARIIIEFFPQATSNYYERVFCVVRSHQVLYVDLLGTCFDVLTKPMPLMQRHVDIYRHKVIMGVHDKPRRPARDPYGVSDLGVTGMTGAGAAAGEADAESAALFSAGENVMAQEIPIDDPGQVVLHKEMFVEATSSVLEVRASADFVDYNFTESGRISGSTQLTLTNAHRFPVDVSWALLDVMNRTTGQWVKNPFRVRPAVATIEAGSAMNFQCEFAPYEPDQYFFQTAQCFVTLGNGGVSKNKRLLAQEEQKRKRAGKSQAMSKTKTLLGSMKKSKYEDALNEDIDPPLCLAVRMVGHSFPPGSQAFIPMIKLNPAKLVKFPPCGPAESVYQTVQIRNTSDTPVYYKIQQDPTRTFRAFPPTGLIRGQAFVIVCFEFAPRQARDYNFVAQFIFNHNASNVQRLDLVGHCYEPALALSNNSKLFFPPVFKGVSAKQQLFVQNQSRIPLLYEWKVPEKYRAEVQFQPPRSLLKPNEEAKIVATFTALKQKDYHINIPIYAKNIYDHVKNAVGFFHPGSGQKTQPLAPADAPFFKKYTLEIIGRGADGGIQILPAAVDFGTITVGFHKTMEATVFNRSSCNIFIELRMQPRIEEKQGKTYTAKELAEITRVLNENFQFDMPKGIVNARSKKTISITFKPQLRYDFDITMVCIAKERLDKDVAQTIKRSQGGKRHQEVAVEKAMIDVKAKGDYPLLRFEDVRNDTVSIANLWECFQMTKMNKDLLNPLNDAEKVFNNSGQTNQSMDELIRNLTVFNWDFGKIPSKYGSKPRKVTLTLKNIGGVEAHWQFKLPNDSEIELEKWADPGEPTPERAFEKHILDNKIFNVQPRSGHLLPGKQMELNVFYYPKEVDHHYLKAFLQILNGKPLIINLEGETLLRRAHMRLIKDVYHLPPTPIGLEWSVTFPIEIKNLGITKLKYQIDTAALEELNARNYDFKVFEISNPEGTLAANDTQYIYCLFRPLEAKEYSVDLPIKISDIEGASPQMPVLKLRGTGYHPEAEHEKPDEVQFYEDLPACRAYLGEEGQQAAFSIESIDFGELETGQIANRFVILYNMHPTQRLKFEFQQSGLMCGDNLKLLPMSGELEPNSHQNIKMTLVPARFPTHFEGEIQCSIEWAGAGDHDERVEMKSMHTNTAINENQEFLFLRLKKRTQFKKELNSVEPRENETIFSNVLNEMVNDILNDAEMEELLDSCGETSGKIFNQIVTSDQDPPSTEKLFTSLPAPEKTDTMPLRELRCYQNELKELTGNEDEDLRRKMMFMDKDFTDMCEYMLEDTIFNLMEEATYEEFDLMQAPKIYIRKDQLEKK